MWEHAVDFVGAVSDYRVEMVLAGILVTTGGGSHICVRSCDQFHAPHDRCWRIPVGPRLDLRRLSRLRLYT
jgi:hypothetical protein